MHCANMRFVPFSVPTNAYHARTLPPRQTPSPNNLPPFITSSTPFSTDDDDDDDDDSPPFLTAVTPFPGFNNDDYDDGPPFLSESDDDANGVTVPPGVIAAIVVSVVAFIILVTSIFAYRDYRRKRELKKHEVALKEIESSAAMTLSGALDPPPPYEIHDSSTSVLAPSGGYQPQRGYSVASIDMSSHPTILDGVEPGSRPEQPRGT
mgnify:CR=1 FL=1